MNTIDSFIIKLQQKRNKPIKRVIYSKLKTVKYNRMIQDERRAQFLFNLV